MIKYSILKTVFFLLVIFELTGTNPVLAKTGSIEVNYGDGWKTIKYSESTLKVSECATQKNMSTLDETIIDSAPGGNSNTMLTSTGNKQQNNINEIAHKANSNVVHSVDMSEPSNTVLIGVGIVLGILMKWRKSLNTSTSINAFFKTKREMATQNKTLLI